MHPAGSTLSGSELGYVVPQRMRYSLSDMN